MPISAHATAPDLTGTAPTSWDKADRTALAASVVAHLVLFGLLSLTLKSSDVPAPPPPMTVELIAESDLEATSTNPSDEAPAAMQADEQGPVDDAAAPLEATPLPEPEPVAVPIPPTPAPPTPVRKVTPPTPPKQVSKTAVLRDPPAKVIPKAAPKQVVKAAPKAAPKVAAKTPARPAAKAPPAKAKTQAKAGTGSGRGSAARPTGDLAGMVGAVGKAPSTSKSTGAPGRSAAQIRQSITTSIGNQVRAPWSRCSVTGIDVDELLTTVKFRLNRDGSLAAFSSTTTTGVNESNRAQQARHQECAKKAIQQASPFTGLAPEHYDYWQNYEFKFQKR